jgi:two-component system sensor histidine kinase HydH
VYYERRARIGQTHVRIALDQRYMLGAMNVVREELHAALDAADEWPQERLTRRPPGDRQAVRHGAGDHARDVPRDADRPGQGRRAAGDDRPGRRVDRPRAAQPARGHADVGAHAGPPPAERRAHGKHLGRVRDQVALCNAIISDLLDLARDRPADRQPTDVGAVARDAALSVPHPEAIAVEVHVADALPQIAVDPGQFRQLVVNLVLNAVQAQIQPPGAAAVPGRVDVRLAVAGDTLVLGVEDRGPGMTPAVLERLFEALFTTRVTGTGLGLALCRRIVEKHNGTIAANNRADGGAAFVVRIPLQAPTQAPLVNDREGD